MKTTATMILFVALAFTQPAIAQKLTLYKTFGNVMFMLNDTTELSVKQTRILLFEDKDAYRQFRFARTMHTFSAIVGFASTAAIALPVGTLAFGEKSDWGFAIGGVLGLVGCYFLDRGFQSRAWYAANLYNEHHQQKTSRIKPMFSFYGTGARLVIKF